jgi:hypothetical protein
MPAAQPPIEAQASDLGVPKATYNALTSNPAAAQIAPASNILQPGATAQQPDSLPEGPGGAKLKISDLWNYRR